MSNRVMVLVGTKKGAFVLESDQERQRWDLRGPYLQGQNVMHMSFDPRSGILFAAVGDPWFGSRVYRSMDFGNTWEEPTSAPAFPAGSGLTLEKIWHVEPGRPEEPGVVYAGVEPAALFKSADDGQTWQLLPGLIDHPTRKDWNPSAGGLCLHTIILDPRDVKRAHIGISAAGVFYTDDGGASWQPRNTGTRTNFEPGSPPAYAEWGQCVHKAALHPSNPDRMYQQNHCGVYRSDDAGRSWTEITAGLPSEWGLPMALHPRDADTMYVCPGQSGYVHIVPEAQMAVYRTRDAGTSWAKLTNGLPSNAFLNVMREGMAVDSMDLAGVYVGSNTGQLFGSADEGETWRAMPGLFPPISSVGTITL